MASLVGRLGSSNPPQDLSKLPNLAADVLRSDLKYGPLQKSAQISVQKASVISFQTWSARTPGLCGVLFGKRINKRLVGTHLIVDQSVNAILESQAIELLEKQESVFSLGVVVCGRAYEEEVAAQGKDLCTSLSRANAGPTLCIFAT